MLRVIGGEFRGRKLRVPKSPAVRPTASRTREAVFDILMARASLHNARFLDLYAGTGAVGIEALSRGAAFVEFVEADRGHIRTLKENLDELGIVEHSRVTAGSRPREENFDLAFADPPYRMGAHDFPGLAGALRTGGFFILENDAEAPGLAGFTLAKSYRHGRARLHLFEREE